jgi:hypothetical protein
MMDNSTIMIIIAGSTLALSVAILIFNGGWGLSRKLGSMESRLAQTIAEASRELEDRQDNATSMFGETASALREQMRLNEKETIGELHQLSERMSDVEKWARDEFVRKESFREIVADIKNIVAEHARNMNNAVQNVRSAVMSIAAGRKIEED